MFSRWHQDLKITQFTQLKADHYYRQINTIILNSPRCVFLGPRDDYSWIRIPESGIPMLKYVWSHPAPDRIVPQKSFWFPQTKNTWDNVPVGHSANWGRQITRTEIAVNISSISQVGTTKTAQVFISQQGCERGEAVETLGTLPKRMNFNFATISLTWSLKG